jgi:hypothetical protein
MICSLARRGNPHVGLPIVVGRGLSARGASVTLLPAISIMSDSQSPNHKVEIMIRASSFVGLAGSLLIACGLFACVDSAPPASSDDLTSQAQSALTDEASPAVAPALACTPGDDRACCPFAQGCSCLGDQICNANGTWGVCFGAGRAGQPCP